MMTAPEPQSIQSTRRHFGASPLAVGPQQDAAAVSPLPPQQDAVAAEANRRGESPGMTKPPVSQVEAATRLLAVWLMSFIARSPSSDRDIRPPVTVGSRGFLVFLHEDLSACSGSAAGQRTADLGQGELAWFVVVDDADQSACGVKQSF